MDQIGVFDRLVSELDKQERRALLVRIQSATPVYTEPLSPPSEQKEIFVPEKELALLGLFQRIILFLRSLFTRRDRLELLREMYLRNLALDIKRTYPALVDVRTSRFKQGLHAELLALKDFAHSLHRPLQEVLEKNRNSFLAFLARNELSDFQQNIVEETDPQAIWESRHLGEEKEVRALMLRRFDELVETIPPASKRRLAQDVQALFSLLALSSHPFNPLLSPFHTEESPTADFESLGKPLKKLAKVIEPVRIPPSAEALYDLLIFLHQERLEDQTFDLEEQLKTDMSRIHAALSGIRGFRERVPLQRIVQLTTGDPQYYPAADVVRVDWFSLYKEFWRQRVHKRYLRFFHSRKRNELRKRSLDFLHAETLPSLENYRADKFGQSTPVQHAFSLSFIRGFSRIVHAAHPRALKLIYLNGEFYKEENRNSFTDAYLFLNEIENKFQTLESRLGPQGDLRASIQQVKGEALGYNLRQKRILDILARADSEARALLDATVEQLSNLKALMYGIIKGKPGDRYDTLVNLEKIGGRENRTLRAAWERFLEQTDQALLILREIRELEINEFEIGLF